MKKFFTDLISVEDAKKIIDESIVPVTRIEQVNIKNALNRVIAQDIVSSVDIPPFNRAAMDGYAICSNETKNADKKPVIFDVISNVQAGETVNVSVSDKKCVSISTGAEVPNNADAVIKLEDVEKIDEHRIRVSRIVNYMENISLKGEDVRVGERILRENDILTVEKIGALAAIGKNYVDVYAKPTVAVIPTGKEIIPPNENTTLKGKIFDINSYTVSALVSANGGLVEQCEIIEDDYHLLREKLCKLLYNDFIVIIGGSSVGEKDIIAEVISGFENSKILFHGVKIKPGKPILFATINHKQIFGLPGFPTSCLLTAHLFLKPALWKKARLNKNVQTVTLPLGKKIVVSSKRRKFITVKIENDTVIPVYKESGTITSMSHADGYIEIKEDINIVDEGKPVTVYLF